MKAQVKKFIDEQKAKGTSYSKVQAALEVLGHAETAKEADALLQEAKYPKGKQGRGVIDQLYVALISNPGMSEEEFSKLIHEIGTKNTIRWEKAHQRVRKLANDIAAKYSK